MYPQLPDGEFDKKHTNHLNILARTAYSNPMLFGVRIAASVVVKNSIISTGFNSNKSHPFQARYSPRPEAIFIHAETMAINNALKVIEKEVLRTATLYITRIRWKDLDKRLGMEFGLARPCNGCRQCIEAYGIAKVVYTADCIGYHELGELSLNGLC